MKNKGYTLVELLAVFVILGIIIMISVPVISETINSSKDKAYDEQVKILENAARTYMSEHSKDLPDNNGLSFYVEVEYLKDSGLISDEDIKNPNYSSGSEESKKKNQYFNGCIKVTNTGNKFTYEYQDECN